MTLLFGFKEQVQSNDLPGFSNLEKYNEWGCLDPKQTNRDIWICSDIDGTTPTISRNVILEQSELFVCCRQ